MFSLEELGGSLVALATPFRNHSIDDEALALLCERQIASGTTGLVICGSTGEAAALSDAERKHAVRIAVAAARGRVPVIAGCTAPCTASSIALASDVAQAGADGLLCAPPPYVKPTQDGIFAHVRAIAHAADLPIVLYDVPGRASVAIADETVARLARAGAIVALKDATADLARPTRLRRLCGPKFRQLSGDDATTMPYRAAGGHGSISVTANVAPRQCAALHAAWDAGDTIRAAQLRDRLDPLHSALFAESNPIPLKAALALLGLCEGELRLPLTRATEATTTRLRELLPAIMSGERTGHGRNLRTAFTNTATPRRAASA